MIKHEDLADTVRGSARPSSFVVARTALTFETSFDGYGDLPAEYHADVLRADWIAYSYRTPIAWRVDGVWTVAPVNYSLTTTQHQYEVARAVGVRWAPPSSRISRKRSPYGPGGISAH